LQNGIKMAKKGNRQVIKLKSTESAHTYWTQKNKKNTVDRISLKKYDPVLRRHVLYKEEK
jgi:large subunit ribosomal protein L33